ncbi:hypothetical protein A0H81_06813 [Grifola frondosa]|uniref:C2H2-type domain-containing protein n=1 Tax=Grifola frondosa TaxID=5627 RepID=A0A1C7ME76_GRIFR|nr:hypothetical protein A0H81_06813 [Grifola frondosa]
MSFDFDAFNNPQPAFVDLERGPLSFEELLASFSGSEDISPPSYFETFDSSAFQYSDPYNQDYSGLYDPAMEQFVLPFEGGEKNPQLDNVFAVAESASRQDLPFPCLDFVSPSDLSFLPLTPAFSSRSVRTGLESQTTGYSSGVVNSSARPQPREQSRYSPYSLRASTRTSSASSSLQSTSSTSPVPASQLYLDADWLGDIESEGNDSDDDYIPSPRSASPKGPSRPTSSKKSNRYTPYTPSPASSSASRSSSRASSLSSSRGASQVSASSGPRRRNKVATPEEIAAAKIEGRNCPISGCPYIHNSIQTWACCGIPLKDLEKYDLTDANISAMMEMQMQFAGMTMVGGCGKMLSRRDALKRHLDNPKIGCVGDLDGEWLKVPKAT